MHEQRERTKGRGERETDTLGTFRSEKRTLHPRAATSDVGSLGRKAKKEFEVPETKLYVRYVVSESLSTPPARSFALPLSRSLSLLFSLFSLARRPSPCRGRGANARQMCGIVMHTGINDRRKEEASEEGLSAGREERAEDKESEGEREREEERRKGRPAE